GHGQQEYYCLQQTQHLQQSPHASNQASVPKKSTKQNNALPLWGNETSMNLNPLILANIQGSSYFKVSLFKLKTYHEVVDEIYYQVKHLEPWERGSRKTAGQTGMCGGVRGVGAGGIVSTAFCLLYKLYTLRLTRKQVNGLLSHGDSPYIRALGFMYLRYTQPPSDLFEWYEPYLLDEEEIDVKAGGGQLHNRTAVAYPSVRNKIVEDCQERQAFPGVAGLAHLQTSENHFVLNGLRNHLKKKLINEMCLHTVIEMHGRLVTTSMVMIDTFVLAKIIVGKNRIVIEIVIGTEKKKELKKDTGNVIVIVNATDRGIAVLIVKIIVNAIIITVIEDTVEAFSIS
uniref:Pre-mRNA-splicing factor 38 n=1 Tax=Anopheles arabiensis TaxID=7173 RepID=A0A182HYC4_ANOAR